jgi:hypothetical protein
MPLLSAGSARFAVVLIPMVAALSPSTAQTVGPPFAGPATAPGSATPEQVRAIAVFRPHVEQVCQAAGNGACGHRITKVYTAGREQRQHCGA